MVKILIINDKDNKGYIKNVVNPLIKIQEVRSNIHITIRDCFGNLDYDNFNYVIFSKKICYERSSSDFINMLSLYRNAKIMFYVDEWWQLPKTHNLYKEFNKRGICDKILKVICKSDVIVTWGNEFTIRELKRLNDNVIQIKRVEGYKNVKVDTKQPVFGVVPTEYDLLNIKQLSKIGLFPDTFWKNNKIVLVGFTNITSVYNKVERCFVDVPCDNNIWIEYEKIITNNYKLCSEEYKEFLLKFLPNDKYKGDINTEPYKRVWKNEVDDDTIYYNILLKPLVKNKYNQLLYDIEEDMAANTIINGKYVQVLNTIDYPKLNINKTIKKNMSEMGLAYRQESIFPVEKKSNYGILSLLKIK